MAFKPRLERPSASNPLWINVAHGGFNRYQVEGYPNSVLPNCTGYAFGRFMEIMGATNCSLAIANAGKWFGYTSDGYQRGRTPQLGAVICYGKKGGAGHVAIVEQINADGSIVTSNSAHGRSDLWFYTSTVSPPDYLWGSAGYYFQGFIKLTKNTHDFSHGMNW